MRSAPPPRPYNVLFLCTGNSARSILAEAILNRIGQGKFNSFSAGSQPKGAVHPEALALLHRLGFSTEGLRSKGWNEFAAAPRLDFVFTVCDNAASEVCPVWPGQPMTAHWGVPDPAAVQGTQAEIVAAFRDAFLLLQRRIELFVNLPVQSLDRMSLKKRLDEIGAGKKDPGMIARRLAAEALGTAFLLAAVVGSGIMGERLAGGNAAIALLANTLATGTALMVLISIFSPVSGAHFNPVVTLCCAMRGELPARTGLAYVFAQLSGAVAGVWAAHAMFALPLVEVSHKLRAGPAQGWSEFVATFGLIATIAGAARHAPKSLAWLVGLYISAAYWFTASTSFANPAVTLARTMTDTFSGIAPASAPGFIAAQIAGAVAGYLVCGWLFGEPAQA